MCIFPKQDNSALRAQREEALQRRRAEAAEASKAKRDRYSENKSAAGAQQASSLVRLAGDAVYGDRSFFSPIGG